MAALPPRGSRGPYEPFLFFIFFSCCYKKLATKVERRYARKHDCDPTTLATGHGEHLHANWTFSPPPPPMTIKPHMIDNHIMIDVWQSS
jgi:hypothetical protein